VNFGSTLGGCELGGCESRLGPGACAFKKEGPEGAVDLNLSLKGHVLSN